MNSTTQLFINFWKLLVQRNWLENFPKVHMQCWIYAFTYFGIPRMYCKKPSWFNLHAWCQFNYISSWFGHLADTNLNFHKCKTHCTKKSRQPWFIRYVIWKKCTSSRFFIQKLTFIQKTEHLSEKWTFIQKLIQDLCKTHCAKKSRQPWFIRYVIWKKCTSSSR